MLFFVIHGIGLVCSMFSCLSCWQFLVDDVFVVFCLPCDYT